MTISLDIRELKNVFADAAAVAVAEYRKHVNPADDTLSQREAHAQFSKCRVQRWREQGLVSAKRLSSGKNSKIVYSRAELLQAEAAENLRPIINRPQPKQKYTFGE